MFADSQVLPVIFPSVWKQQRKLADSGCQTGVIEFVHAGIQSMSVGAVGVQTETEERSSEFATNVNHESLAAFLGKMEGEVSRQLLQNIRSRAFDGYAVQWEDKLDHVQCLHELNHAGRDVDMLCSDLVWNRSGSIVACSYGRYDHSSFCTHKGLVCAWNIAFRDLNPEKASFVAETTSCIMTLAFHPDRPSLLAAGTFNGEVILYDLGKDDDPIVAVSRLDGLSHEEPVVKLVWVPGLKPKSWRLVSAANDGKIITWDPSNKFSLPIIISQLSLSHLPKPRSSTNETTPSSSRHNFPIGITALAVTGNPKEILVGTECGSLLKCSLEIGVQPGGITDIHEIRFPNPILFTFRPHVGGIHSIASTSNHRNLFLTCGTDGAVRLYSLLADLEVETWCPGARMGRSAGFEVEWSPTRPCVWAEASMDGHVYIYDLLSNDRIPTMTLTHSTSEVEKPAISTLAFNGSASRMGYLATGDAKGTIRVWRLSTALTDERGNEMEVLKRLAEESDL